MAESKVTLRAEQPSDLPFLRRLYATTRVDVTFSGLPEAQKQQFIRMQFDAQRHSYRQNFHDARFDIIERKGRPIGRLYVARLANELRVIDITLNPDHRNKGIGTKLLRAVQSEATSLGLAVTLHAQKLGNMTEYYRKLGFEIVEEKENHFFLKWTASSSIVT